MQYLNAKGMKFLVSSMNCKAYYPDKYRNKNLTNYLFPCHLNIMIFSANSKAKMVSLDSEDRFCDINIY